MNALAAAAVPSPPGAPPHLPPHLPSPRPSAPLLEWIQGHLDSLAHLPGLLLHAVAVLGPVLAVAVFCLAAVRTGGRAVVWWWRCRRHARGACVIEVAVPPHIAPEAAVSWWRHIAGLHTSAGKRAVFGQPHLGFEYRADCGGVHVQIWVPGTIPPGTVEKITRAAWPGATLTTRPAAPLLPPAAIARGGRMVVGNRDHFPLATEHDNGADPVRGLLEAMAGLGPGQHLAVQILARPVTGRRLQRAYRAAAHLRGARSHAPQAALFDLATPAGIRREPLRSWELTQMHPERAAQVRAVLAKAAQPRFAVQITYAATRTLTVTRPRAGAEADAPGPARPAAARRRRRGWLRTHTHQLAASFAQYTSPFQHLRRRRLFQPTHHLAARILEHGFLLGADELAALAHLPYAADAPGIIRAGARPVAPSPRVPGRLLAPSGPSLRILGDADGGPARPVGLTVAGARQHTHVVGQTGVGKSTFLAGQILADVRAGRGALVIDPKGDLIIDVLDRLPERAIGTTVVFDPAQDGPPPCLNVLAGADPAFAAEAIVTTFRRCFASSWGPRMDDLMRAACLTLTEANKAKATLADLPRLLEDDAMRVAITGRLGPGLLDQFWKGYGELSPGARAQLISPVMNKLRAVLLRPFVRDALSGTRSTVDLAATLDHGGLILVRAAKGLLGEDAARLLGSLVLAHTWQAMTPRAALAEDQRRDVTAYIDEAHNFLNLPGSVSDILAEARAYRFGLVIAHQHLSQFPRDLREAVSADARNKIYFAVSPEDAHALTLHTAPLLTEHDLTHLGAFQAAARIMDGPAPVPAFTFRSRPLPEIIPGRAEQVRAASRAAFSPTPPTAACAADCPDDCTAHPPATTAPHPGSPPPDVRRGSQGHLTHDGQKDPDHA
ncbi:type IV secretory system conjugative DNA transfer family protein [Actinomadura gamaensis]|uniref:Type IV secretory system conjugative DNA transfer family protein n=1 Tax=Actinomadura gamaensis TaxID=1763541 RepID=A0ABV9UB89_9ACTN